MSKIIEVTRLRLLKLTLDGTHNCLILKYAEEDVQGRAVAFNKAIFFEEYPKGRGPYENWYLMDTKQAQAVEDVATALMHRLEKEILEQE